MKIGESKIWQSMTECEECKSRNFYLVAHPSDPCPKCGGVVVQKVGRWTCTYSSPWYKFWETDLGTIELKGDKI